MNDAESGKTFRRLGAISVLLGALSMTRMGLELYQARAVPASPDYFFYLGYDFLMAVAACVSGAGLLRGRRWATAASTIAAAALCFTSVLTLVERGKSDAEMLLGLGFNQNLQLWAAFGSRLFLTAIHAIYWPIVAGHVYLDLQCRDASDPKTQREKRRFWWRTGATLLACVAVEALLRLIPTSTVVQSS